MCPTEESTTQPEPTALRYFAMDLLLAGDSTMTSFLPSGTEAVTEAGVVDNGSSWDGMAAGPGPTRADPCPPGADVPTS